MVELMELQLGKVIVYMINFCYRLSTFEIGKNDLFNYHYWKGGAWIKCGDMDLPDLRVYMYGPIWIMVKANG